MVNAALGGDGVLEGMKADLGIFLICTVYRRSFCCFRETNTEIETQVRIDCAQKTQTPYSYAEIKRSSLLPRTKFH